MKTGRMKIGRMKIGRMKIGRMRPRRRLVAFRARRPSCPGPHDPSPTGYRAHQREAINLNSTLEQRKEAQTQLQPRDLQNVVPRGSGWIGERHIFDRHRWREDSFDPDRA